MMRKLTVAAILPLLGGAAPLALPDQTCVDVSVGNARSYDCINRLLEAMVASAHGAAILAPSAATESANRTGQATESATRERLGTAFGHSVVPQRPTTIFVNPLR